ncbi:MAG: DMT family transporter [Gammaproteobacteria bacterium]|nr:DMT family transporter [Gammaproteobacteria bacterium]MYD76036.1 DMT family transporter [Gammaproteobacteria bacterium]MYJ53256.1 DMT family transporter [Gammaproteobacteria bacterium]
MTLPVHGRHHQPLTGALLALCSMSLFSWQDALIKLLAEDYSLFQILFIRSGVIVLPLFCILYLRDGFRSFRTARVPDHAKRVTFNLLAFLSFYFSITRLELGQATALVLSAPLIMTALSGPLLGERASVKQAIIILIGFAGVVLVIQPISGAVDWVGTAAALCGAFMFAMLGIQTRSMSATEATDLMVFFAGLTFFCLTGLIMLGNWVMPVGQDWLLLLGVGVISLFAQLCIVHAYRFAPVYILAPFEYVTILWALVLGWLMFAEIPTALMLAGAGIIIACGLAIVHIEHRIAPPGKIAH